MSGRQSTNVDPTTATSTTTATSDGVRFSALSYASATENQQVGAFQLGNCIGKGAYASVYRALNLENGNIVAVKRFETSVLSTEDLESFKQEVAILKNLSHPNVVTYYDSITTEAHVYLILEFVENGSLLSSLKQFAGRFPEKLVAVYTRQVLQGLAYIHGRGVIHCDIKAANLLTTKMGHVKLTDFGVSLTVGRAKKDGSVANSRSNINGLGSGGSLNHGGGSSSGTLEASGNSLVGR